MLKNPREIEIMVAYAGTWASHLQIRLKQLAEHGTTKVKIILPDPEDSATIEELARRFESSREKLLHKIEETVAIYTELFHRETSSKNRLELWYLKEPPLYTYYKIDDVFVFTTYRHNGKGDVPTFVFAGKGLLADFVNKDVRELVKDGSAYARKAILAAG